MQETMNVMRMKNKRALHMPTPSSNVQYHKVHSTNLKTTSHSPADIAYSKGHEGHKKMIFTQ